MSGSHVRLGELLVEAGVISPAQLNQAVRRQTAGGGRLGTNLVELGFIDEKTLAGVLSKQLRIPAVTAAQVERVGRAVVALLPALVCERLRALPVREDGGRLWVAMQDPTDAAAVNELKQRCQREVRPMVAPELLIQYGLERHYGMHRRPRTVDVYAGGVDLELESSDGGSKPLAAPVYEPVPAAARNAQAVASYLDDFVVPPPRGSRRTLADIAPELAAAADQQTVLKLALGYLAQYLALLGAFVIRDRQLLGWRGVGLDEARLRRAPLPVEACPLLARALAERQVHTGVLEPESLGLLAGALGLELPQPGAILPLSIGARPVGCIVGIGVVDEAADLDHLVLKLNDALHISYLRRRLLSPVS